jgi:dihydrolipoamide dehydrogenase
MGGQGETHFDLGIIGCGSAGFAGAMRALDLGKRVCLVEGREIGGAGVMWGALASKTLWELAKDYDVAAKTDRGYRQEGLQVDYRAVRDTVLQAVRDRQALMLRQLAACRPGSWPGKGGVDYLPGTARLAEGGRILVQPPGAPPGCVAPEFILLACGSRPRVLPGLEPDGERIFDSDTILELQRFPRRLLILGAGIIGCEYATIFSNFRQTEVYLVDSAQRVLPFEDQDVSRFVSDRLQENGVRILHRALLKELGRDGEALEAVLEVAGGEALRLEVDAVLVAVGRLPNTEGLGLPHAGVPTDPGGCLLPDADCRLTGGIYSAGDLNRHPALVNIAETEARYAVKHMFGANRYPLRYRNISTVMFLKPAVAAVGLSEGSCRERGIAYRVATYGNALLTRAIAMRATTGFVKIIVSDDAEQRILGMRAAGPQVSGTIVSIALLMDQEKRLTDVLKSVHPHPTMSEGIQECLRLLLGKSIFKPHAFPELLRIATWSPEHGPATRP